MNYELVLNKIVNFKKLIYGYFSILLLSIGVLTMIGMYRVDDLIATIIALLIVTIISFLYDWSETSALVYFSIIVMFSVKVFYLLTLDPIVGPDEINYYAQLTQYEGDLKGFLTYFFNELKTEHLFMSAYPAFGFAYIPIYSLIGTVSPYFITVINAFSLILLALVMHKMNVKYFNFELKDKKVFYSIAAAFIIMSPSMMFWTSTFSKDVFGLLIAMLSIYYMIEKKYIRSILLIAFATMIRPYSIVFTFIYYCIYKKKYKLLSLGMIGSFGIVYYEAGASTIINSVYSIGYLFFSPNPLKLENWNNYPLPVLESFIIAIAVLLSFFVFVSDKKSRGFYYLCIGSIIIYALAMALVGHEFLTGRGMEYRVGVIGDNIMRKKLPIIMILYMMLAYAISSFSFNRKNRW